MTTEALTLPPPGSTRTGPLQRLMAGRVGPVLVVLLALLALWYVATVWLNAPFARQIAPDPSALQGTALVAATMSLERPVLPAPHQVAVELWRSVVTLPPSSRRSLLYHAWVTLSATLLGFAFGTALFLFAMTALGIVLATIARSMPQFGLLAIPFFVVMNMLSGGVTPLESMPRVLQLVMTLAPSTHYTTFAQSVLYRGAGLAIVWPQLLAMAAAGIVALAVALIRFRATMSAER